MRSLWIFILLSFSIINVNFAQSKNDIDPEAKKILDKLKKQYDSYKSMEVSFTMELELPGKSKDIQKGTVIQDGKKYQVKMKDQEIYADGKTVWFHLVNNKEVQISDMDDSEASDQMSPKQMMRLYEKGEYAYAITGEKTVSGKNLVEIEFKPLAKRSEYTKLRLTVDKKSNNMISLHVFSRDGSRYALKVSDIKTNKKYDSGMFVFNPKAVPGLHIEDLRMD